jgi:hypothetical protein
VDSESLLCIDLPFTGLFIYYDILPFPEFFSRPYRHAGLPAISGKLDFLPSASNTTGKMLYADSQNRRLRPWPRTWPKSGRRLRYATNVNFSGADLTASRRVMYFHFFRIAFSVLRKIK